MSTVVDMQDEFGSDVGVSGEPTSVQQAEEWRDILKKRVTLIDIQLKQPNRVGHDGRRLSGDAYWEWRSRATAAQSFSRDRLGYLRRWIKEKNRDEDDTSTPMWELRDLFAAAALAGLRASELGTDISMRLSPSAAVEFAFNDAEMALHWREREKGAG